MFLETGGSTHSVKLPPATYSVNGAVAEGSWVLLSRCADEHPSEDSESEDEFEDDEEESGGESVVRSRVQGGGGSSLDEIGEVEPIRGRGRKRRPNVRLEV